MNRCSFAWSIYIFAYRALFTGTVVGSGSDSHVQDATKFLRREREERLECYCKRSTYLKGDVQDGSCSVHICLCHLPWFRVSEILVSKACDVHRLLEGLTELVTVEITLHLLLEGLDLCESLCIDCLRLEVCRDTSLEIFMSEHHCTVHEVAEDSHELAVVA